MTQQTFLCFSVKTMYMCNWRKPLDLFRYLLPSVILSPEGVLHKFRLHLCQRPVYKILVQNINNE